MTRVLLTAVLLAAAPASAQVRFSAGALAGYQRTDSGSETSAGINAAVGWGRLLGQVRVAEFTDGQSEYRYSTSDGIVIGRNDYTTFGVGADVQAVQRIAGPVSVALGAGVTRSRYGGPVATVDGVALSRWETVVHALPGVLVGSPGRVRIQARLAIPLVRYSVDYSRAQVGVLVPIR